MASQKWWDELYEKVESMPDEEFKKIVSEFDITEADEEYMGVLMMISNEELDKLAKRMKEIAQLPFDYAEDYEAVYQLLVELKDRRESDLRPATKFVNTTCEGFKRQLDHVKSEITEIEEAYEAYTKYGGPKRLEELADEITDAQSSLQTLKADVNVVGELDKESCRRVTKKNAARGYYDGCS